MKLVNFLSSCCILLTTHFVYSSTFYQSENTCSDSANKYTKQVVIGANNFIPLDVCKNFENLIKTEEASLPAATEAQAPCVECPTKEEPKDSLNFGDSFSMTGMIASYMAHIYKKHFMDASEKNNEPPQQLAKPSEGNSEANVVNDTSPTNEEVFTDTEVDDTPGQKLIQFCQTQEKSESIADICFFSGMLRSHHIQMKHYHCNNKNDINPPKAKNAKEGRPCFTEDYVKMTAQAFNEVADCFNLSTKEKYDFFATFNHESAFNLNVKSGSGARCYGQITFGTYNSMRQYISPEHDEDHHSGYHNIYAKAKDRCPNLEEKLIHPKNKEEPKSAPLSCSLTQDPYSCFFYSMYNIKRHMLALESNYNDEPSLSDTGKIYIENIEEDFFIEQKFKKKFIGYNDIVTVEGVATDSVTGKIPIDEIWILVNDTDAYNIFHKKLSYNKDNLTVKKLKLFNPTELKKHFVHTAHNGGHTYVKGRFEQFMVDLKEEIVTAQNCPNTCNYSTEQECEEDSACDFIIEMSVKDNNNNKTNPYSILSAYSSKDTRLEKCDEIQYECRKQNENCEKNNICDYKQKLFNNSLRSNDSLLTRQELQKEFERYNSKKHGNSQTSTFMVKRNEHINALVDEEQITENLDKFYPNVSEEEKTKFIEDVKNQCSFQNEQAVQ